MADAVNEGDQTQFLLADFNTRLRDIDERNRLIRERVLLLGKNLITSKQELETELKNLKKENSEIKKDIGKLKDIASSLVSEFGKFIKKDEMVLVERMLKDFQPLEFMRKKDVEELISLKMDQARKQIKTTESI